MDKICQKQLLIEYMIRYGRNLPDERMLEVIDINVIHELPDDVKRFCGQMTMKNIRIGENYRDVLYR